MVVAKEAAVVVAEAARVAEAPQEASEATVVATEAAGGADHIIIYANGPLDEEEVACTLTFLLKLYQ